MVILDCPNCGARNVSEYRYGGEYNPRPAKPLKTSDADWSDYVFMRRNKLGVQVEWWFHASGCGTWFLAERHTKSNEVIQTLMWEKDVSTRFSGSHHNQSRNNQAHVNQPSAEGSSQ